MISVIHWVAVVSVIPLQVLLQTQQQSKSHHRMLRSIVNMGRHGLVMYRSVI